jgi:hypothetical protein
MSSNRLLTAGLIIITLLVFLDFLSVSFVLVNPEGYWDREKINGIEAVKRLLPVFGSAFLTELAALISIMRRGLLLGACLLAIAIPIHIYAGLHICADCAFSPGEAAEIILATISIALLLLRRPSFQGKV